MRIKIKKVKPETIVSIRQKIPSDQLPQVIGKSMMQVMNFLENRRMRPSGPPVTLFHDTNDSFIDFEVGIPVNKQVESHDQIKMSTIPSGKAVYALYKGSLENIAPVYAEMIKWANERQIKTTKLWWERYLTDPRKEPDQSNWKTEIYYQIA